MSAEIQGFCHERFQPLREAFRASFDEGLEIGASLAATWRGETVVDLWGGWSNLARTHPWERDTIVHVASTTKIMVTLCTLMLIDRGQLDLDAPVASYWPEFAQGGKGAVTVRDAMSHRAGVPGLDPPIGRDAMLDWPRMTARIAAEPHWFGGERRIAYHHFSYGYILGELMRRVDGRTPARFFREEIAGPLGLDFHFTLSDQSQLRLLAQITPLPESAAPDNPTPDEQLAARMLTALLPAEIDPWTLLTTERPSGGGMGNARSIAGACAILAMKGEVGGRRFMSADMVAEAGREQAYGRCPYLGWLRMGLGFGLDHDIFPAPSSTAIHWGGAGGSIGVADSATGVSAGYAPNNWAPMTGGAGAIEDPRDRRLSEALGEVLKTLPQG